MGTILLGADIGLRGASPSNAVIPEGVVSWVSGNAAERKTAKSVRAGGKKTYYLSETEVRFCDFDTDFTQKTADNTPLWQQLRPGTSQRLLDSQHGCQKDIDVPSFDLLHRANVQVGHLGQPLLRHRLGVSFTAHIRPEIPQLRYFFAVDRHAALRREPTIPVNGALGRKILKQEPA